MEVEIKQDNPPSIAINGVVYMTYTSASARLTKWALAVENSIQVAKEELQKIEEAQALILQHELGNQ